MAQQTKGGFGVAHPVGYRPMPEVEQPKTETKVKPKKGK